MIDDKLRETLTAIRSGLRTLEARMARTCARTDAHDAAIAELRAEVAELRAERT